MQGKICAIHQPNFFPWLGYFDKIRRCDRFVILDDVQYPKTGSGTWLNRVAINIQGQRKWLSVPIDRKHGLWQVRETFFCDSDWRDRIKRTVHTNYSKAKNYGRYIEVINALIEFKANCLVEYNMHATTKICELLNIDFSEKTVLSSALNISSLSTQRLIDITKAVDCDTYMSGGGASQYQDTELFEKSNTKLFFQNFSHPVYDQQGTAAFMHGLSIIDYLFNAGC